MRGATSDTRQPHQALRLPRKMTHMLDSSPHMKRHLQCAEQQVSPSNLTKYCACHEKWQCKISKKIFRKRMRRHLPMHGTIREWSDHETVSPQPASQPRLLFEPTTSIFYWKIQRFAPNLTLQHSPSTAPATKSDTWTSPSTAPATKSDTWTSPSTAPVTKSDTWTSPSTAPVTKSNTSTSPKILHLPRKVTLELHQILHLPRKVTLELHQVLHLSRKVTLLYLTLLYLTLLYLTLLYLTLLYVTLLYLTLLYLTLLGCRSYIGSFSTKLPLIIP